MTTQLTSPPAQGSTDYHYDLILIGSGMGALTVASLMAQLKGKRVLLLERHFQAGGFTHDFKRGKFHWDVGIHYVGNMGDGEFLRKLFDLLTAGQVQWQKMPHYFEQFVYPGLQFQVPSNKQQYQDALIQRFPQEAKAIRRYFKAITNTAAAYGLFSMRRSGSRLMQVVGWLYNLFNPPRLEMTTQEYLDRHFQSPALKALLASQWGDYGLPPSLSPFALHSMIVSHYLDGGYYPVGGGGTIAAAIQGIVERKGGQLLVNREVQRVIIENGRAVGVEVRRSQGKADGVTERYYAPVIISNAGVVNTYQKLIPADYPIPFRQDLEAFCQRQPATTHVGLYLGLSQDPRSLGFQGENHWLYASLDHNQTYHQRGQWVPTDQPPQVYLSFPSLKDAQAKAHTAEILAWVDYSNFAPWRSQPWRQRDQDYQQLKQSITERLIAVVDRHYPGFANLVDYAELSTPLTNEHFTAHPNGAVYGLPFVAERFRPQNLAWTHPKTPLPGLYLTGADVCMLGIAGAMMGGLITLGNLPDGLSVPQVFASAERRRYQSPLLDRTPQPA
ncbi:MAG: NAD(P)/FAD-dependent oxidoreductase [Cyanobacteria bacterium]|nr:NAD(P)/FAD-dependent oxidoreductase [Cyanobacteriota bacterium]MDW8200282.1 NAD(P)/FAD-dependent oxidoreductase [Cyanobacteriota bacterium SKYGB_h_bin112]